MTLDVSSTDATCGALPDRIQNVSVPDNDAGAVVAKLGANLQAPVDAKPVGTMFWIETGEHRLQSITPKAGQHFLGAEGAVLNGSRELTGFVASGSTWYVGGRTQEGWRHGTEFGTSGSRAPAIPMRSTWTTSRCCMLAASRTCAPAPISSTMRPTASTSATTRRAATSRRPYGSVPSRAAHRA